MKKLSIVSLVFLAACQQASAPAAVNIAEVITVLDVPASEAADSVAVSRLPEGFPLIAEMQISETPKHCGLSKTHSAQTTDPRFVFTFKDIDEATGDALYQIGVNGRVRTLKETKASDNGERKIRFFKTVDAPEVEIMVTLEADGSPQSSVVGRVKAWDGGFPLMCAYNRIEVQGDCDLSIGN